MTARNWTGAISTAQHLVVVQFEREASQTRDYCVAKNATQRAARPDSSPREERLFGMTIKLHHYPAFIPLLKTTPTAVAT